MCSRSWLCYSLLAAMWPSAAALAAEPEKLFTKTLDVNVPHISTDKSVKYDYDIVYVRAHRAGDKTHKRFYTDFSQPVTMEPGADLVLLHPNGKEELLVAGGDGSITDPFVSFDGQWVYYARIYNLQKNSQWEPPAPGADLFKYPGEEPEDHPAHQPALLAEHRRGALGQGLSHAGEFPGPEVESDEELSALARATCHTVYHVSCTARMGAPGDPAAVLDPQTAGPRGGPAAGHRRRRVPGADHRQPDGRRADAGRAGRRADPRRCPLSGAPGSSAAMPLPRPGPSTACAASRSGKGRKPSLGKTPVKRNRSCS